MAKIKLKTNSLKGKSILLGITGSIASQKIPELVNKLINKGATVRLILTNSAKKLFNKAELKNLSKKVNGEIYDDLFEKNNEMSHIYLTRQADLFLIAPISAESIAKLALARANDLLSTTALASDCPIMLAPAMNHLMYQNELVQKNIAILREQKQYQIIEPDVGHLACNEFGIGRLVAVDVLLQHIETFFNKKVLLGKKVLMTIGATIEHIDPVRFISNFSSGKMGFAICEVFLALGAEVTIIQGKVDVSAPTKAKIIPVLSAAEMHQACHNEIKVLSEVNSQFDFFIASAAVSDFKVKTMAKEKIKKEIGNEIKQIELIKNIDILKSISELKQTRPKVVVGFAAETENLKTNALKKLKSKNCDFLAANLVGKEKAFAQDTNELLVLKQNKNSSSNPIQTFQLKKADKRILAKQLIELISPIS